MGIGTRVGRGETERGKVEERRRKGKSKRGAGMVKVENLGAHGEPRGEEGGRDETGGEEVEGRVVGRKEGGDERMACLGPFQVKST